METVYCVIFYWYWPAFGGAASKRWLKYTTIDSLVNQSKQTKSNSLHLIYYLHPCVDSDKVGAVIVDKVSERTCNLRIDGQEGGDLDEGDQVKGAWFITKEELFISQHLGQNLE